MSNQRKPRIALTMGDPQGIGPELVAKLITNTNVKEIARIVLIGDSRVLSSGKEISRTDFDCYATENVTEQILDKHSVILLTAPAFETDSYVVGSVSEAAGQYQLDCLASALDLCQNGITDGVCFAPLNKDAMHRAGLKHDDELGFFKDHLQHKGQIGLLNTLGNLWTSRATSHIAHKNVSDQITTDSVLEAVRLVNSALRTAGYETPVIAVAGLNPHAGDGGMFGDEEIKVISPAVQLAKKEGINVEGPFPPDTIFLMGRDGKYDAIVTMYHDQGQIAMKLMGFDHGVTVHAGLPFPVTTSAHGSAFDIAGQGIANVSSLREAFYLACSMTGYYVKP